MRSEKQGIFIKTLYRKLQETSPHILDRLKSVMDCSLIYATVIIKTVKRPKQR